MDNKSFYIDKTSQYQAESAIELASELFDKNDRLSALAGVLLGQLTPIEGSDPVDYVAFRLAELLDEQLGDATQHHRLKECLAAIKHCVMVNQ